MRKLWFVASLTFLLAACASQGQKSAEIEQRDVFDQQQAQSQAAAKAKADDEAKQASIAKEQEELKSQLEAQKRAQQAQGDQAIVKPLPGTGVGGSQLKGDAWAQLKEPGSPLAKRSVYYEYNRYDIKEEYVPVIDAHAKFLMDHTDLKIAVQGNCDDRGSREYNLALGARRAESVKRALVLAGADGSRISAISYGSEKPVTTGKDEESYRQNRRADIVY